MSRHQSLLYFILFLLHKNWKNKKLNITSNEKSSNEMINQVHRKLSVPAISEEWRLDERHINPIQNWLAFSGLLTDGWEATPPPSPLPKICQTYPKMIKLGTLVPYLKKTQKNINHVTHPLSPADISIFSLEISKFCYIKK